MLEKTKLRWYISYVYLFPVEAVTNDHNLGGLKKKKMYCLTQINLLVGLHNLWRTLGENPCLASDGRWHSWCGAASLQSLPLWSHCHLFCLSPISFCLSLIRTFVIGFSNWMNIPGWYLHLKILNLVISAKTLFPHSIHRF